MPTEIERPDVLDTLASMRPDHDAVDRVWNQSRRQAVLQRALSADARKRPLRSGQPTSLNVTKRWVGAGLAVAAVSLTVVWLVPPPSGLRAVPAPPAATSTPAPSQTAGPDPRQRLEEITVSTAGWKTFSSPEYPITFQYPADWRVRFATYTPTTKSGMADGCAPDICAMYVSPPGQNLDGGHAVVLVRKGFRGGSIGRPRYDGATVIASVPNLTVWTSNDATSRSTAALATRSEGGFCITGCSPGEDFGPPYEYMLSTSGLDAPIAVGDANPLTSHPEAAFTFGTNWGPESDETKTVATILASSRQNPDFKPTQPNKGNSGR